jgi:hypothetical protein
MTFSIDINDVLFIEESVLEEKTFLNILENLINQQSYLPKIILDVAIKERIKLLNEELKYYKAFMVEGYLELIHYYFNFLYIDTHGYFDLSELKEFKENNTGSFKVLTNKSTTLTLFTELNVDTLYFVEGGNLKEWDETKYKIKEAFYEDDPILINDISNLSDIQYVYSKKYGYLRLDYSYKFEGGEGMIVKTYHGLFAKIYNKKHLNYTNYKKLQTMLKMDINRYNIAWPLDIIYSDNNFVGYLMKEIPESKTLDMVLEHEKFAGLRPKEIFGLARTFLETIHYLHQRDVIIGDLKPDNIIYVSPNELYFVDTGSFQIEDYACPVGLSQYTKRDIGFQELKEKLRTIDDEYYPINYILFQFFIRMSPTENPFSIDNDYGQKQEFYYPLTISNRDLARFPNRKDLERWAKLPHIFREKLYYYFTEYKITDISEWIHLLDKLLKDR